jgi:hypothetical protein
MKPMLAAMLLPISLVLLCSGTGFSQTTFHPVVVDKVLHGAVKLAPELPADGKYAAGTVVTVTAIPDEGYVLDSVYYSTKGRWGAMYYRIDAVAV